MAGTNPLLGVFLASIIGNVVPFFPVPYLFIVGLVASRNPGIGLIPIAIIAASGAAIGKFAIYAAGYGAGGVLSGKRARFDSLRKLLGGSAFLAAFIFAASPLPDDVVFIPLGVLRYSPVKTFISLLTGKFVLALAVAYTFRRASGLVDLFLGGSLVAVLGSIVAFLFISVLIVRIDWERVLDERKEKGLLRGLMGAAKDAIKPKKTKDPRSDDSPSKSGAA